MIKLAYNYISNRVKKEFQKKKRKVIVGGKELDLPTKNMLASVKIFQNEHLYGKHVVIPCFTDVVPSSLGPTVCLACGSFLPAGHSSAQNMCMCSGMGDKNGGQRSTPSNENHCVYMCMCTCL